MRPLHTALLASALIATATIASPPGAASDDLVAPPVDPVEAPGVGDCMGLAPTIIGTRGPDLLVGTEGADVIHGWSGDDRILGRGGDDTLCGGAGDDLIAGSLGSDRLSGGFGDDTIYGGSGSDVLDGGPDSDILNGGIGDDVLTGGAGDDRIGGGAGDDTIKGGNGGDLLKGRGGVDDIDGGRGDDVMVGGTGLDVLRDIPGEYPHPRVGQGTDGWLYLADAWVQPCSNTVPHEDIAATAALTARIVESSGRSAYLMLVPGKDVIHPEHLGGLAGDAACAAERGVELRAAFRRAGIAGWIDMAVILARRAAFEDVYFPVDSHWTTLGGLLASKQVVDRLDPALFSWREVRSEEGMAGGAQANLIGSTVEFPVMFYRVVRDGTVERLDDEDSDGPNRYVATAPGGVIDSDTLVLHDSFGHSMEVMLPQYLAQSTWVKWSVFATGSDRYDRLAGMVAEHDVLVIESSERGANMRFGRTFVPLPAALIRSLLTDLPASPVDLAAAGGGGWSLVGGSIVPFRPGADVILSGFEAAPVGTHRFLAVSVAASSSRPVRMIVGSGEVGQEFAPRMDPGGEYVLIWDLTAAGNPAEVTLLPGDASIRSIDVVDIP